jgi:anti-sigma factor RsiW
MNLYLDERLDASGALRLERHLVECPACKRDLARLRLAEPALREADPVARAQVPAELADQIMRRVAAYEAQRAADLARARQRRMARREARGAFWRGPGLRVVAAAVALIVAVAVWWRSYPANGLAGAASRLGPNVLQWLATPGPDAIAWAAWIAGAAVALGVGGWLARADASAAWRRALVDRLPQLW